VPQRQPLFSSALLVFRLLRRPMSKHQVADVMGVHHRTALYTLQALVKAKMVRTYQKGLVTMYKSSKKLVPRG